MFGLLVGAYTVAARTPLRTAVACLLLFVPVMAYSEWQSTGNPFDDLDFIVVLISGFWIAGRVVWSRQQLVQQLADQSEELRRARDVEARALVAEQRARIARDVHDIVAHSVSIMVVQAEAGEAQQPAGPSAEYLRAIMRVGRSTLTELRSVLGALDNAQSTDPTGDEQARAPSPRLRDAARLVGQLGSAGLDVDLRVDGDPARLPGGIDLAAYRVLQEALTNALRHSGAGRVRARVRVTREEVVVDVLDPGCEPGVATLPRAVNGTGRGLVGMRERVRVYGGEVETGPVANGFRVHARIPVPASATEAP